MESHLTDEKTRTPGSSEACPHRLRDCCHELSAHSTTTMEPALRASAGPGPESPVSAGEIGNKQLGRSEDGACCRKGRPQLA